MCGNDAIAGYAIKALSEKQMAGKVVVTGQDAIWKPVRESWKVHKR